MTDWGTQDVRHPGRRRRRQARHQRPGRHQPRHPDPARPLVLRGLGRANREMFVDPRPAGQPGRPPAPVEPAHDPEAGQARLRRRLQLDHVAALVRRHRPPRRSTPAAARSPGSGRRRCPASSTSATSRRPGTACRSTCRGRRSSPRSRFEWKIPQWSNALERNRARTYFQAYAAALALHFCEKALAEIRAGHTKTWTKFEVPDEAVSVGFTEAVRGVLSHHMVIRTARSRTTTPTRRRRGTAASATATARPGPTRTRSRTRRSSRRTRPTSSRASTSCGRCAASTRACRAACTCTPAAATWSSSCTRPRCRSSRTERRRRRARAGAHPERRRPGGRAHRGPPGGRASTCGWATLRGRRRRDAVLLRRRHRRYAARGRRLEIEEVAGRIACHDCGTESEADDLVLLCPCGSADVEIVAGEELRWSRSSW